MSVLYLVRHGQASFLTENYDRLSDKGVEQSRLLGEFWAGAGVNVTHAYSGSLQRQRHTADAVRTHILDQGTHFPDTEIIEGLNEYPADKMIELLVPALRHDNADIATNASAFEAAQTEQLRYRYIHRLLEAVMRAWVGGHYDVANTDLPSWPTFSGGVRSALTKVMRDAPSGSHVAVFTSGGPIGIAVQTVLEAPQHKAAELNWRVHNASVTRMTFSGSRISLDGFNHVEHLPEIMRTYR